MTDSASGRPASAIEAETSTIGSPSEGTDQGTDARIAPPAVPEGAPRAGTRRSARMIVAAATMLFFASCLGFLVNTPTGFAPDETFQFDRVMAAWGGDVVLDPEQINTSTGSRGSERTYYDPYTRQGPAYADMDPILRENRPSFTDLGGNTRSPQRDVSNYMTQHPPLYYGLMGSLTRLVPGAVDMPADGLYLLIRFFNVLLLLPVPFLFWFSARQLVGTNSIAAAAAFLPLLVPGLARESASINNDNLAIVLGAAIVGLSIKVISPGTTACVPAAMLAGLAVAASLTKGTILFMLVIIPLAYGTQVFRRRSWPPGRVIGVLVVGAVFSSAWWVRNTTCCSATFNPLRWEHNSPGRRARCGPRTCRSTWASSGATWATRCPAGCSPLSGGWSRRIAGRHDLDPVGVRAGHHPGGVRGSAWTTVGDLTVLVAVPVATLAMVLLQMYLHYASYVAFVGAQGRYAYPSIFGFVFPVAVVAALTLGRHRRWAPVLVTGGGLVVSGWALYTSVEYFWLPRGEQLQPSNWLQALQTLGGYFPLPGAFTVALTLLIGGLVVAGTTLTVLGAGAGRTVMAGRLARGRVPARGPEPRCLAPGRPGPAIRFRDGWPAPPDRARPGGAAAAAAPTGTQRARPPVRSPPCGAEANDLSWWNGPPGCRPRRSADGRRWRSGPIP